MNQTSRTPVLKKSHFINPFVVLLGTSSLFIGIQALSAIVASPFIYLISNKNLELVLFVTLNIIFLVFSLSIIARLLGFSKQALGLRWPGFLAFLRTIPAFLLYLFASLCFTILATKFIPGFDIDQAQEIGFDKILAPLELVAAFLSLVVFTPIFEEVIFRGVLFRGLRLKLPFWVSALVTSLLFALAHGQLNVAIDTFALSLLLCYLVERHNSIYPAIFLHALKNGFAFVLLFIFK